ncbi:MAG TPA: hypothetical protein VGO98_01140 [Candidatus Saccharimonadales bacterium]|jgi:hypothetical protein|nr:hypothetical protein [Candidatus Saccharimonadales bacterium]
MDWAQILVIILSIFLAIFLLLAIILTVLLIKLTRQIKEVTGTATRTAQGFEQAIANFTSITSPLILFRSAMKYIKKHKK